MNVHPPRSLPADVALSLLAGLPLSLICWDARLAVCGCNAAARQLFGLGEPLGQPVDFDTLSPLKQPGGRLSAELAREYLQRAFAEGGTTFAWLHCTRDGTLLPTEVTLTRAEGENGPIVAWSVLATNNPTPAELCCRGGACLRELLDSAPMSIDYWDREARLLGCNTEAVKLFGLRDEQEYIDKFYELIPEEQPNGRASVDLVRELIRKTFAEGPQSFPWTFQKPNNEQVFTEVTLAPTRCQTNPMVVSFTRDLSEFRTTQEQLSVANERTQLMLDAMPLCANFWDRDHNNIDCNLEAVKLFELSGKQEYLERFYELSPEYQPCGRKSAELAEAYISKAFTEGGARFEWMHKKLDGEPIPAEITLVRLRFRGENIVAGYTRDLRELKIMLAQRRKVEEDLRLARDVAENSAQAKSQFLANMSHEIRTPMNGIQGMLHLLLRTGLEPLQESYLQKALYSTRNLLRIIDEILDFSKIDAGKMEIESRPFDLADVFAELGHVYAPSAAEKGLALQIDTSRLTERAVEGDQLRLKQVLFNLVNNAIKFTEHGAVRVGVEPLESTASQIVYAITVADTGIGISAAQTERIFTAFTQADASTTRKYGGTGLGLAICQRLVDLMGGSIRVDSVPQQGTTFHIRLPFVLHTAQEPEAEVALLESEAAANTKDGIILVVEDNEINQLVAKELLQAAGYTVDLASDGCEAVSKVHRNDYALVLMDIQMPCMDGLTATARIRQDARYAHLPIIAMSAHAMQGDREKSLQSGMNDHLTKPIDPDALYETVARWHKAD